MCCISCKSCCASVKRFFKRIFKSKKPTHVAINIGPIIGPVIRDEDPLGSLMNLPGNHARLLREQELGYDHSVVLGGRTPAVAEGDVVTPVAPAAADVPAV